MFGALWHSTGAISARSTLFLKVIGCREYACWEQYGSLGFFVVEVCLIPENCQHP